MVRAHHIGLDKVILDNLHPISKLINEIKELKNMCSNKNKWRNSALAVAINHVSTINARPYHNWLEGEKLEKVINLYLIYLSQNKTSSIAEGAQTHLNVVLVLLCFHIL